MEPKLLCRVEVLGETIQFSIENGIYKLSPLFDFDLSYQRDIQINRTHELHMAA